MINSLEYNTIKELDIIDVQALDMDSDQTWLHSSTSGKEDIDIVKWRNECNWLDQGTIDYKQHLEQNLAVLESIEYGLQKKFDSRTYTRPKKRMLRPSLHSVTQGINYTNNNHANFLSGSRTITKHSKPFFEERRQTFNSNTITKYKEVDVHIGDDDSVFIKNKPQDIHNGTYRLDSGDMSDDTEILSVPNFGSGDGPPSYTVSKPIQINLSEPAHNLHNTFNKIIGSTNHRNDSLSNMSPPSLVSSIAMDGSGTFNSGTFSRQGSICSRKDSIFNDEDVHCDDITAQNSLHSDMTTSILDEKEMNTSMLSHCQDDSLIGSLPPSLGSSMDSSLINSSTFCNTSVQQLKKDSMESSLINSGTFNSMLEPVDEKLPSGKPKFQLRKSFLKPEPDENFDRFLMLNANCNTDDLRGLSGDLLRSMEKRKCDTYRKDSEKENMNSSFNKDDTFLMTDGMSDSFLKETGRESLNITYNKLPQANTRTRTVTRPQMEMEQTIVLPNQILSPLHSNKSPENNNTFVKKLNGTYDTIPKERESPKRNGTFRKLTPPSIRNVTATLINTDNVEMDDVKDMETSVVDSNKECYVSTEKLVDISAVEESREVSPTERLTWTPQRRKQEGITMAGGSSDSLEQNSSGSCSPHRVAPLNMHDLEHLAYEQEQKLYQVISTPISKPMPQDMGSAAILFQQNNALSPILNHQPKEMVTSSSASSNISESPTEPNKYGPNSSSLGSLNRMAGSPRRLLPVKRESSAPEIKSAHPPSSVRMPFAQKLGMQYKNSKAPSGAYGSDNGLYVSRSAGGSPAKTVGSRTSPLGSTRALGRLEPDQQLTSSNNELRRKSGLPASKLRQYSSHKELNRIPAPPRWSAAGGLAGLGALRPSSRLSLHASNPALCPAPLVRQASYTLVSKDGTCNAPARRDFARPAPPGPPKEVVRQQTQTEASANRIPANLAAQANSGGGLSYGQPMRAKHNIGSMPVNGGSRTSMATGINSQSYIKIPAPSAPLPQSNLRPPSSTTAVSHAPAPNAQRLPRPSGLPRPSSGIPRKPSLRPPSTYSLAPRPGDQTSDCY